jgi:DNA end-binding protein Ku
MLTPEELESVEPGRSRTIDIADFVDAAEIDPIYYQKSYFLAPSDDAAKKAYALLVKAMTKAERIGVATFVMRGKQYLAAIRPRDDLLVLETMYFADEVRDPTDEIDSLPTRTRVGGKDLDMAVSLVESLTTSWDPTNYRDTYTERVEQLIDAKKKDREIVVQEPTQDDEKVSDLLEALEASVDAARKHKPGNTANVTRLETRKRHDDPDENAARKSAGKKSTGKKSAGKKSPSKKSAGKKSSSNKSTSKKTTSKKTTSKKSNSNRSPGRKSIAKKSGSGSTRKAS